MRLEITALPDAFVSLSQMPTHKFGGSIGIAANHPLKYPSMFLPDTNRLTWISKNLCHGAAQMLPVHSHRLADQRVSGQIINERMEIHVRLEACACITSGIAGNGQIAPTFDDRSSTKNCFFV